MLTDEMKEAISAFVESNEGKIIGEIAEVVDNYKSSYEYTHFCPKGWFVITDICEDDDHLCSVYAKGEIEEGEIKNTNDGTWPDVDIEPVEFMFFVDQIINGKFTFDFCRLEDGKVDLDSTFIPSAESEAE